MAVEPFKFPRKKNNLIDDGSPLNKTRPCPNCKSSNFIETISTEFCVECGLKFDLWKRNGNKIYKKMQKARDEQARRDEWITIRRMY